MIGTSLKSVKSRDVFMNVEKYGLSQDVNQW